MKKMICLALLVLAMVCVFTGCAGTAYTDYGYGYGRNASGYGAYGDRRDSGNVSTSRDGTVNGYNRNQAGGMTGRNGGMTGGSGSTGGTGAR